jgi:2-methylcitrate dehydratase PrpD
MEKEKNITNKIADFVCRTNYNNLSYLPIDAAKKCILDGIGVAVAGSKDSAARVLAQYIAEIGCKGSSTVLGLESFKTSAAGAALVNGVSAHVLDFDDTHRILGGHPTAVILPTVLSLGEYVGKNGKDILTAFVLAVEVAAKIGRGVNPSHYHSGYHVTSSIGVMGAAAGAGKLLELDNDQLLHTFGIAGSMSSGLKENFGTMTKSLHVGLAASNGVRAAMLASRGYTASMRILEGNLGFCKVLAGEYDLNRIVENLGDPWEIVDPGVARKKYPCCARTHPAIEGVVQIVTDHDLHADHVEEVICSTDDTAFEVLIHPVPHSELEAKFSMPFCVATAFLEKDVALGHFSRDRLEDPRVTGLMRKVRHLPDKEIIAKGYANRWLTKVTVRLKTKEQFSAVVERAKGDPLNPMTDEEIVEKFTKCTAGIISPEKQSAIIERIRTLDLQDDISGLVEDLAC